MTDHKKTFYLKGEKKFSTLKSLAKELFQMDKEVYQHHVNSKKNDFSVWIKGSIKEESLAKKIDGEIEKIEMELQILRHLVHEAKPIKKKSIKKNSTKTSKHAGTVRISTKSKTL